MSRPSFRFWPASAIFLGKGVAVAALLSITVGAVGRVVVRPQLKSWAAADSPTATPVSTKWFSGRSLSLALSSAKAINTEEVAKENYEQAISMANQAVVAYQSARAAAEKNDETARLSFTRQERDLWQEILQTLATVPVDSPLYEQAIAKHTQYQTLLATAESKLLKDESDFLVQAVQTASESTGVSAQQVHITLCQIEPLVLNSVDAAESTADAATVQSFSGLMYNGHLNSDRCWHYQGSQPMASPASLIKLPIAIALMHKVTTESIDFDTALLIDPDNFTENAEGEGIEIGDRYPLREVMAKMISQSDNIATNQLIDYLGRDYLDATLKQKGYVNTWAGHKLAGDRIMPKNAGTRVNQSTTNELTAMLAQIYSLKTAGDEELLSALVSQKDRALGYEVLKDLDPAVKWIGEKTGQNDRVIASSVAVKVGQERYALTVAINHSGDPEAVRNIIRNVISSRL